MKYLLLLLMFAGSFDLSALGSNRPYLGDSGVMVELGTALHFTNSKADSIAGAEFSQKYTHSQTLTGGFSILVWDKLILGIRYSHWLAGQKYSSLGNPVEDSLVLHEVGGNVGFQFGNPRIRYRLMAGVAYPLGLKVVQTSSSVRNFIPDENSLLLDSRFQIILKLYTGVSLLVEAGYRWADLGVLKSEGTEYLNPSARFDLSGPFIGTGIGIHF